MQLVSTDKIIHERCDEINNDKTEVLFFCFSEHFHVNQLKKTGKFHLGTFTCCLSMYTKQDERTTSMTKC